MTYGNRRLGKALPAVLVVALLLISAPVLLIGVWRVQSVVADDNRDLRIQDESEQASNEQELNEPAPIRLPGPPHIPEPGVQYRPVIETSYREETVTVMVPEFDPKSGKQVMRTQEVVRKVPVQTTRWVKSYTTTTGSAHDQRTIQLANELRNMKEDNESRKSKLSELRAQLEREFTRLHQKQLAEIERTEQRLESLKVLQDQRGENKNNIVQRRIDELLGKADPLAWNVTPVLPTAPITQPAPQSADQWPNQQQTFRRSTGTYYYEHPTIPAPRPPQTDPRSPVVGEPLSYAPNTDSVMLPPAAVIPRSPSRFNTLEVREYEIQRPDTPNPDTPNPVTPNPVTPNPVTPNPDTPNPATPHSGTPRSGYQQHDARPGPADEAPTSTFQTGLPPAFTQLRVGIPNSALGEVFQLARNSANANAELAEAEIAYEQLKELRGKGAIPLFEFQTAKLKFEKCKREVRLIDMQLEALSAAMDRVRDLAESTLEYASSNFAAVTAGHRQGVHTEQELVNAKYELEKAEKALRDAVENVSTLKRSIATVKGFDDEESAEQPSDDPPPDVQADSEVSSADESDARRTP